MVALVALEEGFGGRRNGNLRAFEYEGGPGLVVRHKLVRFLQDKFTER